MMIICLFTVLLLGSSSADPCDDSCVAGEICLDDGRCMHESLLVDCGLWQYCMKGDQCCNWGCIPEGEVCCGSFIYCESGHSCCGSFFCCIPGAYCDANDDCQLCENGICNSTTTTTVRTTPVSFTTRPAQTTRQPYTRTPARTTARPPPRTTRKRFTTKSYRTTINWRDNTGSNFQSSSSSKHQFTWWYGLIISAAVVTLVGIVVFFMWKRRTATLQGGAGSGGIVLGQPVQAHGHQQPYTASPNYGVVRYTVPTNTGPPPPYTIIGTATNPNSMGNHPVQAKQVPEYKVHQTGVDNAAFSHTERGKQGSKNGNDVKYLPHL